MSKQVIIATAGLATTTGVGSQYMSSVGSAVSSLNATEEFSPETEGEAYHQAFAAATPSTFLNEGIEDASSFMVEELSGFESSTELKVVEAKKPEEVVAVAPTVSEPAKVVVPEVKKVEVTAPKVAPAKPVAVKPAAKKPATSKAKVVKRSAPAVETEKDFKTEIQFKHIGWERWNSWSGNPEWRTSNYEYFKTRRVDTKSFTDTFSYWRYGSMTVKCNREGRNYKCWNPMTRKSFLVAQK